MVDRVSLLTLSALHRGSYCRGKWQKLDDVFWTVIPFGTGGRRGRMYEFGSNAINERTIGESAQGLASYILEQPRAAEES
ncbi:MAG: hypothetical protein R3C56_17425 [Pirellulaceae bacterium]